MFFSVKTTLIERFFGKRHVKNFTDWLMVVCFWFCFLYITNLENSCPWETGYSEKILFSTPSRCPYLGKRRLRYFVVFGISWQASKVVLELLFLTFREAAANTRWETFANSFLTDNSPNLYLFGDADPGLCGSALNILQKAPFFLLLGKSYVYFGVDHFVHLFLTRLPNFICGIEYSWILLWMINH